MYNKALEINDYLIKTRRFLHQIPELAFEEHKTSEFIAKELEKLGIEFYKVLNTGIVGLIKGKKGNGKTILLRADIDALPIQELNNIEYKSKTDGKMHACGHDAHITSLLGVARILKEMENELPGNVKLVFQPAEEGNGGAEPMIKEGILLNPVVDAAVALHVEPLLEVGKIQYRNGSIMASPDDFKIIIKGIGGHGACPENCINPINAASELILKIKTIVSDNFSDDKLCVVSVCTVNAGTANNIIPDVCEITGTARSLDNETREKIEKLLYDNTKEISNRFDCKFEFVFNKLYPPVINDKVMNEIVINAAKKISAINEIVELENSSMTGDDFSYFAQAVPGAYFKLGVGNIKFNKPLHNPEFNIDEKALPIGASLLAQIAIDFLGND